MNPSVALSTALSESPRTADTNGEPGNYFPSVSVVIATRNRPELLERALKSIADQTLKECEVIIVDDGSTRAVQDEYDCILRRFDSRFRLLTPSAPGASGTSPAIARNRGLKEARGEFVAFMDDDDYWLLPDNLDAAVKALRQSNADYYFSKVWCARNGHYPMAWEPDPRVLCKGRLVCESPPIYDVSRHSFAAAMKHCLVHVNVTIVRRSLLNEIGGFLESSRFLEDLNLMLRLADRARRILFRPEYGAWYQLPQGNSVSLIHTRYDNQIQELIAAQHARLLSKDPLVRKTARARESWALRELSRAKMAGGSKSEGVRLAWQAFAAYSSPGSLFFLIKQFIALLAMASKSR